MDTEHDNMMMPPQMTTSRESERPARVDIQSVCFFNACSHYLLTQRSFSGQPFWGLPISCRGLFFTFGLPFSVLPISSRPFSSGLPTSGLPFSAPPCQCVLGLSSHTASPPASVFCVPSGVLGGGVYAGIRRIPTSGFFDSVYSPQWS